MFKANLLTIIYFILFIGIILILLIPSHQKKILKIITLTTLALTFTLLNIMWVFFNNSIIKFQYSLDFCWLINSNLTISFGVDGISLFFIMLTTLLFLVCLLFSWNSIKIYLKEYLLCFFNHGIFFNFCFFDIRFTLLLYFF